MNNKSSLILIGIALFVMGLLKGYFSKESMIKSGTKFFLIAVMAGVLSELIGSIVTLQF